MERTTPEECGDLCKGVREADAKIPVVSGTATHTIENK